MSRHRRIAALAALGSAALLLAACFGSKEDVRAGCPKVLAAPDADKIALFAPGGHEAKDVMVAGRIIDLGVDCEPLKVGYAVNANIAFEARRANNGIADATFPYFVALLDPNQHLLEEQDFSAPFKFLPGESYRRLPVEKITVNLPVKNRDAGASYTVVVGFQLTPDQIGFNRAARQP